LYSSNLKANPLWVPVTKVVNEGAVKAWKTMKSSLQAKMIQIPEQNVDEYLERLSALERIRDYRYPVMIIHTDDYEEITESFIRVNSRGTRLRDAELAMAQLAFHWPVQSGVRGRRSKTPYFFLSRWQVAVPLPAHNRGLRAIKTL